MTVSSSVGIGLTGGAPREGQIVKIEWKDEPFEGGNLHRSLSASSDQVRAGH